MTQDLDEVESEERIFVSIGHLLEYPRKVSIATLATAIERKGISGWDRFGRFMSCKVDDPKDDKKMVSEALDHLAYLLNWESEYHPNEQSPIDLWDGSFTSPLNMGWYADESPDFAVIATESKGQAKRPTKQRSPRAETTDLNIIAVLVQVLLSKQVYKSEAKLIEDLLTLGYGDYAGISQRTLEKRFAAAKISLLQ